MSEFTIVEVIPTTRETTSVSRPDRGSSQDEELRKLFREQGYVKRSSGKRCQARSENSFGVVWWRVFTTQSNPQQ